MQKKNAEAKQDRADGPDGQKSGSAVCGVETSQPTKVISVETIIPSQNLR
jgi:hypothetical protein